MKGKHFLKLLDLTPEEIGGLLDLAAELKANRMETRANSVLMLELLKNARLPEKRKDEIIAMYNKERNGEEVEADDAADEA